MRGPSRHCVALQLLLLLVIGPAVPLGCQAQGLPAGPPFASGAALRMPTACEWATDISGHHPIGPGLAGGADSPAQASAAACEKWCCETSHMKTVDHKPGDAPWKFTEEPGGEVARQCEFWAWKEAPANDAWTKGCWVAGADFVPGEVNPPCPACGKGNAVDPTWLGAQKCLDPGGSAWGGTFVLLVAIAAAIYAGGGTAYGSKTGGGARRGGGGRGQLGPLSAHPHASVWLEIAGLVADGVAFTRGGGGRPRRHAGRRALEGQGQGQEDLDRKLLGGTRASSAGGGSSSGSKKERSKEKQQKKKKSEKKEGSTSSAEKSDGAGTTVGSAPGTAAAQAAPAAKGKGSWVHVPN